MPCQHSNTLVCLSEIRGYSQTPLKKKKPHWSILSLSSPLITLSIFGNKSPNFTPSL
ncbi:hypothetical protein HanRHA438_Chr11g0511881 [Helianthus annuus]|nr:hypothetical protein HanRHA438_Chr11g0511881 [Helianthus annuus]